MSDEERLLRREWAGKCAREWNSLSGEEKDAFIRHMRDEAAARQGEWAGVPMPIQGRRMVLEPRYPFTGLDRVYDRETRPAPEDPLQRSFRSEFYSHRMRGTVWIYNLPDGKVGHFVSYDMAVQRFTMKINTLGAAFEAWDYNAEMQACTKLTELIKPHLFKIYMMTGVLLETSERSGVTYFLRRGLPTVATKQRRGEDSMSVLCTLCLHPIGYYEGTFAGVMVPTDEVIAHLLLIRADERKFWAKANQHYVEDPLSGL